MPRAAWHRVHSRLLSTWPGSRTICPDQLFPARKSPPPPSSLPCCSTARRITLHLELTHLGRSSARFGGRISVSASLFPPACSPLAGDGSAGCRRRRAGRRVGSLGRTASAWVAPCLGYQPFPGTSLWVPMPRGRGAAPVPAAVAGWAGGACPLLLCMCVVGRGEALHLIILRIFLCCGCHYCSAWTLPAPCLWGRAQWRQGVNQSWGASTLPIPPGCPRDGENQFPSHPPACYALLPDLEQLPEQKESCPTQEGSDPIATKHTVLSAARDACTPFLFIRAGEALPDA